jgi:nucleotide-binding universal stress UspA family protein
VTATLFDVDLIEEDAEATLASVVAEIDTTGLDVNPIALRRATVAGIVETAQGASVLVVGSRGRGAMKRTVFGSVASQVSFHAPCPLVVVPPAP